MPKQITVVLLDDTESTTERYLELTRELLQRLLKKSGLWVASVEITPVQEAPEAKTEESAIVKLPSA